MNLDLGRSILRLLGTPLSDPTTSLDLVTGQIRFVDSSSFQTPFFNRPQHNKAILLWPRNASIRLEGSPVTVTVTVTIAVALVMNSNRPHKLLEQVPLTVSPFVSLPTAPTLSYNYKTLPSNIPPSALGIPTASEDPASQPKPRYVVSSSGHAAHPDDIIASCRALQAHVTKMQEDAEQELRQLGERIRERELAEKRRLAPGWLDSDARLLKPEKSAMTPDEQQQQHHHHHHHQHGIPGTSSPMDLDSTDASGDQGAQLDRAFGGMALQ